jgi:hypothetical protein
MMHVVMIKRICILQAKSHVELGFVIVIDVPETTIINK